MDINEAWILYSGSGLFGVPAGLKIGHMPLALGGARCASSVRDASRGSPPIPIATCRADRCRAVRMTGRSPDPAAGTGNGTGASPGRRPPPDQGSGARPSSPQAAASASARRATKATASATHS